MSFIKKHKRSFIAISIIIIVLIISFFFGGTTDEPVVDDGVSQAEVIPQATDSVDETKEEEPEIAEIKEEVQSEETEESVVVEDTADEVSDTPEIIPSTESEDVPISEAEHETEQTDTNNELTCTLSVRCDAAIGRAEEKESIIPDSGIIYFGQAVAFTEGETVFDVLLREMKKNNIHLEFEKTPIYNSVYIEGIGNLYEFDCGERSGWKYKVNDQFLGVGCSQHKVKKGDTIEWVYTCD